MGEGELWREKFDYVYRVPLKILLDNDWKSKSNGDHSPLKRLVYSYLESLTPDFEEKRNFKIEDMVWLDGEDRQVKDRILLLLDGYDEVANFPKMTEPILAEALAFRNIILTSRPNAMDLKMAKNFDRRIENSGLGNFGINQYFHRYFQNDQEKGEKLQKFLAQKPAIRDICNIPVNIAMLCFIWSEKSETELKISSMSDLYGQVVHHLGVRHHAKQQPASMQDLQDLQCLMLDSDVAIDELRVLQHVAYRSLIGPEIENPKGKRSENRKIKGMIRQNDEDGLSIQSSICYLREKLTDKKLTICKVYKYGLLKTEELGAENSDSLTKSLRVRKEVSDTELQDLTFTFLHSSFQEYLAAQYLVQQLKNGTPEEQARIANFIARHRNEPRLELILKFMAGILKANPNQNEKIIITIKIFWDAILCNPNGALELGIDAKVNLLMNLLGQVKEEEKEEIDERIPNQALAVQFIDCRVLENILWWVKELKESDYISPNIKEGLLQILLNDDFSWSTTKSEELSKGLSLKLQRQPLDGEKYIPVLERKEKPEEESPVIRQNSIVDKKILQEEIGAAVSSLILKFSQEEQKKIIQKLLQEIKKNGEESQVVKKNINAVIKIVQTIKVSLEDSRTFIEILLYKIFDEELRLASRIGIEETLKASEEPVSLKEFVKGILKKKKIDTVLEIPEAELKGVIELVRTVGSDDIDFLGRIVKIVISWGNRRHERVANLLSELVEGCGEDIISQLIDELFNTERMNFNIPAIVSVINSEVMKTNLELVNKIAQKTIPLLREDLGPKYYRALDLNHALVPLLGVHKEEAKIQEIAKILISKLKSPDKQEIEELGKTLELIAREYVKENLKLLQKMINRLTPCLESKREKVKELAFKYITTIAQASQESQLSNYAIKALTPSLCDEDKDIRKKALESIIELFHTSEGLDTYSFKKILNNLIKNFDTFDPSKRNASSKAIKDLVRKSGNIRPKWLKEGINALMLLIQKTSKVNKREIALDTILDLVKNDIKDNEFTKELIKDFTYRMKKASPEKKARLGAMVVRLEEIMNTPDTQRAKETYAGLTRALKTFFDDTKLISAKNMLGIAKIVFDTDPEEPKKTIDALLPLLKIKDATLQATIVFYITEIFEIAGDKNIQLMKEVIPTLFVHLKESPSDSQAVWRSALLGFARLLEVSKDTDIQRTQSIMNALMKNQSSIEAKKFTAAIQGLIRAYEEASNKVVKGVLKGLLVPLVNDDSVGKIVSEEIDALLTGHLQQIESVHAYLNELLKEGNAHSKGRIFKLKLDLMRKNRDLSTKKIQGFVDILRPFLQNEDFEIKQNAFAYLTEVMKISGYENNELTQDLNDTLNNVILKAKGQQLQAAVPNNIVNFLKITGNKDKKLFKDVLLFFIASPHCENGEEEGEKKSCSWVLKLLRTENNKEFLDEALKDVIPKLDLIQHSGLVQKLSVHLLQHIDIIKKCLDHPNPNIRKNFRVGMLHYFKNYLRRFEALEELLGSNPTDLSFENISERLFDKVVDEDGCIKRTFDLREYQTQPNSIAAWRLLLAEELDRAETRQRIQIIQVAFVVIAKVEYSQHEVERKLPEVAWEVISLLLKYFKKDKLIWIYEKYQKLKESVSNSAIFKAIFGKLYHKILEGRVITPLEERLITLFIQQGLATSITKKGEITFQDVKYDIEGSDIRFMLEKIARIIIEKDQDLLAKQYKTNTPIFEKSYKNGGIKEAAVDKRIIISVVDPQVVLRNDFWVLSHLRPLNVGSEIVLLEQRSAFGDHVVYKLEEEGESFKELQENFNLEEVFDSYHPGLMFHGRSKILSPEAGQELVKRPFTKFEDTKGFLEEADFYSQQELLKLGEGDRLKRTLAMKQDNPLRALEDFLDIRGVLAGERGPLRDYYEGFISTFSSVYMVSTNVNSSTFNLKEIEVETFTPVGLFTKLIGLIPYGIGEKLSDGILSALNYVENNKFKNKNKFITELANDPVDLSDWVSGIARKKLGLPGKIQQIINAKEEDAQVWIQKIQGIVKRIEEWKKKLTQMTGENNLFVKGIQKSPAFRLGESEANEMIEAWFEFNHGAGEVAMSRGDRRIQFIQSLQKNQDSQDEITDRNHPIDIKKQTDGKKVNDRLKIDFDEPQVKEKPDGWCSKWKIF